MTNLEQRSAVQLKVVVRQEFVSMSFHEFAQCPLSRSGWITKNFDRVVAPGPLFHRF